MKLIFPALSILGVLGAVCWLFWSDEAGPPQPLAQESAGGTRGELEQLSEVWFAAKSDRELVERQESAAPEELPVYSVHVVVRKAKYDGAELVPNVQIQLGCVLGKRERGGSQRGEKFALVETRVDEVGEAVVQLAIPAGLLEGESSDLVIWGWVDEGGYRQYLNTVSLPDDSLQTVELLLHTTPGQTVHGRLFKPDGSPATTGRVFACRLNEQAEFKGTLSGAKVGRGGYFTTHFAHRGAYALHAAAIGSGAVTSRVLHAGEERALELELTLEGAGVIGGRVVREDGEPFPNCLLQISPSTDSDEFYHPSTNERIRRQWAGGLTDYSLRADEDGLFSFAGLQAGAYEVRGLNPEDGDYSDLLTTEPVYTGNLDLVLTVARCRLLVRVLDWEGAPLKSLVGAHDAMMFSRGWREPRGYYPPGSTRFLYCEPCDVDGRVLSERASVTVGRSRLADGAVVLDVEPGKSYVVGVISQKSHLEEMIVHIPQGVPSTERILQLAAPVSSTSLLVRVLDPAGEPYKEKSEIRIYAPESGRLLLEGVPYYSSSKFWAEFGAGVYRIEVSASPRTKFFDPFFEVAPYALAEEFVELHAGQENFFELRLASRGLLELRVALEPGVSLPTFDLPKVLSRRDTESWRLRNHGVLVRLEPLAGGTAIFLNFAVEWKGRPVSIGSETEERWVRLNQSCKSVTPIPVGEYDLVLSPPGFRELRKRVTIEEDKTTKLEFTFTQRDLLD